MEILVTMTSKGQVIIPAEVRRHLSIATGDRVVFTIDADSSVRVTVARPAGASLKGIAGSLAVPLSWPEIRAVAREDRAQRNGTTASSE